jgi:hypothetical protein
MAGTENFYPTGCILNFKTPFILESCAFFHKLETDVQAARVESGSHSGSSALLQNQFPRTEGLLLLCKACRDSESDRLIESSRSNPVPLVPSGHSNFHVSIA